MNQQMGGPMIGANFKEIVGDDKLRSEISHTFGYAPAPHINGQADFPYIRLFG